MKAEQEQQDGTKIVKKRKKRAAIQWREELITRITKTRS